MSRHDAARPALSMAGACLLASILFTACVSSPGSGSSSRRSAGIEEVHLFGLPVAVNLDSVPGPDGFSIRVYASRATEARGLVIRDGALDILLYDGAIAPGQVPEGPPLRTWTLNPQQLKAVAEENRLGIGYELTLRWTGTPPTRNRVTVFARYRPPNGKPILSGPSAITLTVR